MRFTAKEAMTFAIYLVPICGSILVSAYYLGGRATELQRDLQDQRSDFEALKRETYTLPMAAEQALRMALENPGMKVPDPRDPNQMLVAPVGKPTSFGGGP